MSSGSSDEVDSRDVAIVAAVANTVTNEKVFESERGRCWPSSSENGYKNHRRNGDVKMETRVGVHIVRMKFAWAGHFKHCSLVSLVA